MLSYGGIEIYTGVYPSELNHFITKVTSLSHHISIVFCFFLLINLQEAMGVNSVVN